ncbi:glycoside hydrolase family 95 protein [Actinopolymorpha sp. B9G3]|uniref:glycoside hydrolase family 95 protein n=1 Tax=Actinopolymorpha sp. B9G3 TaxID=3158970 RepID=UPI0032D92202
MTVLQWRKPAPDWIQALPIGDGRMGAKVFGGVQVERYALNVDTLWSGRPQQHGVVDGPRTFDRIREHLLDDNRVAADALVGDLEGPYNHAFQPLGDLYLRADRAADWTDYRAELDLAAGIASCEYRSDGVVVRRRSFVSRTRRALVVGIQADAPISFQVRLESPHPVARPFIDGPALAMTGFGPATVDADACLMVPDLDPALPGLRYGDDGGVGFATVVRVGGDARARRVSDGEMEVEGEQVLLWLTTATTFDNWRRPPGRDLQPALATAISEAAALDGVAVEELIDEHVSDHGRLYDRVSVELGSTAQSDLPTDERVARSVAGATDPGLFADLYNFSRYLLVSSSRPGTEPATLQGLWNEDRNPPWFSSYTTNINVEMNYWIAEHADLAECAEPFLDYVATLAEAGEVTAREVLGLDGWCANHNTDIWRGSWPVGIGRNRPTWALTPTCGMWAATALVEHDAFRPDDGFVRERALPVLAGAARLGLSLLVDVGGRRRAVPSTSPENNYVDNTGATVDFDLQTTFDLALLRTTFDAYLGFADRLGIEDPLVSEVRGCRHQLDEFPIGRDGRLQEWSEEFEEPEPGHRHLSHLFPLYPGREIDPVSTPELADAASLSLAARRAGGSPIGGWTHAWMACLYARLFDAEEADWVLRHLVQSGQIGSGLLYQSRRGIHQIDANFGIGAAVSEMLLQSNRGVIRPLAALPATWSQGRYRGLRARGGVGVSAEWAEGHATVELVADTTRRCRVAFPSAPDRPVSVELLAGRPWRTEFTIGP